MNEQMTLYRHNGSRLGEIADRQHTQIRRRHHDLRAALLEGAALERILQCASDLIITTLLHFESEERAMGENPHQCLMTHSQLHSEMIASLSQISCQLEMRKINGAMELLKFFEGRLSYHLDVEDSALERELAN